MLKKSWIIIGIIVLVGLWFLSGYNGLVKGDEAVKGQWANVESVYQRRLDLIPNIVATVKGAAKQDLDVFTKLAEARSQYAGATTPDARAAAASQVESSLARLLVIVENYPDLKSQASFQALITELEGSENRISVERMRYNEAVQAFNAAIRTFPKNVVAGIFGFAKHNLFEAAAGAEQAPAVDFTK